MTAEEIPFVLCCFYHFFLKRLIMSMIMNKTIGFTLQTIRDEVFSETNALLKSSATIYGPVRNTILGFHSRDFGLGNGCYPPSLRPSSVNKSKV